MNFIGKKLKRIYAELDRVDLIIISSYKIEDRTDRRFERLYDYRCSLRRGMYQALDRLTPVKNVKNELKNAGRNL